MCYWYVVFVKSGKEEKIVEHLNSKLVLKDLYAFVPRKERLFRRNGIDHVFQELMFPGYVFIETKVAYEDWPESTKQFFYILDDIRRFLDYADKSHMALKEEEKKQLLALVDREEGYCLKRSKGIVQGDRVEIVSGGLYEKEVLVKKMERQKRQAVVEMVLFNEVKEVTVALEILERR